MQEVFEAAVRATVTEKVDLLYLLPSSLYVFGGTGAAVMLNIVKPIAIQHSRLSSTTQHTIHPAPVPSQTKSIVRQQEVLQVPAETVRISRRSAGKLESASLIHASWMKVRRNRKNWKRRWVTFDDHGWLR